MNNNLQLLLSVFSILHPLVSGAGILYPRTSETRQIQSLDGLWDFAFTNTENLTQTHRGHLEKWYRKSLRDLQDVNLQQMAVPASYNDIGTDWELREHVGLVWYQRNFFVPKGWKGEKVWLRFSSVCYAAEVWVNGKFVISHEIGHLPFQADVTDIVNYGAENNVTVSVDNTLTSSTVPQGSTKELVSGRIKQSYNFDFFNYAGIDRPVVLYTTPSASYIEDISIHTNVANTTLIQYEVKITGNPETIKISILDKSGTPVATSATSQGTITLKNPNLWWPYLMDPYPGYLYHFKVEIRDSAGTLVDSYTQKFGVRSVTWDKDGLYVNQKKVYFRGFGRHEDSDIRGKGLDWPLILRDHNLIKWLGANSYRTSHYPYAEEIMDIADEIGIMIIDEAPACTINGFYNSLKETHKQSITELYQRDKNRPSVVMWSVANEPDSADNKSEAYFKDIIAHFKSWDLTRPITLVNNRLIGEEHVCGLVDIISFNLYESWYEDPGDIDVVVPLVIEKLRAFREKYQVPVLMSEYGTDTQEGLHSLPNFIWSEEYQDTVLSKHFEAFDELRSEGWLLGEHIWNFADFKTAQSIQRVGGNKKGIFTRNRQPKSSAHLLRRRYWTLAHYLDGVDLPEDLEYKVYSEKKSNPEKIEL